MTALSGIARQSGITTVEFAIVGAAAMMLIFGVLEVSRMMYTRTLLEETVRRGARMATVCPVNDPMVVNAALFATGGGGAARPLPELDAANLSVQYLNAAGGIVADAAANTGAIKFVRVSIQNFSMNLVVPFANQLVRFDNISATLQKESLGNFNSTNVAC